MSNTTTGTVTQTVVLASVLYANSLRIAPTAILYANGSGETAVTSETTGATLDNVGYIYGANATTAVVTGYIVGPGGREVNTYRNVDYSVAGDGVSLTGAQFDNFGNVFGGIGPAAGDYGAGVYLSNSSGSNSGLIEGGAAWGNQAGYGTASNGDAAPGVVLVGGYFQNDGTFVGGQGLSGGSASPNNNIGRYGGQGGDGVTLTGAAILKNGGSIKGGSGGIGGDGSTSSEIILGSSDTFGGPGGSGGTGVYINGGTVINSGLLIGGSGGAGGNGGGQAQGNSGQPGVGAIIQSGLLVNDGTISGDIYAVSFAGAGTLQVDENAVFDGIVQADLLANDVLTLSGNSNGTIWIGQDFLDFSTLDLSQGTSWTVEGNLADLEILTITGLSNTDTLELYGVPVATPSYIAGVGLEINTGKNATILPVVGGLNGAEFIVAPCFCRGTHIRTPQGDVPVEGLSIGDEVVTAFAGTQRIQWIGQRFYEGSLIAGNRLALPVCIKKNALEDNVPSRDLWVSPDHAICEAGVLIHAWRLVNGTTIIQAQQVEHVNYIHIELHGHHIVFAENCATESFRDVGCRSRFQNTKEILYDVTESPPCCLPLVEGGFHLHNIQTRLNARAGIVLPQLPPGALRGNLDEISSTLIRGWGQDVDFH